MLDSLDSISNDCCEVADSQTILQRAFAPWDQESEGKFGKQIVESNMQMMDFLNSEHLNMNPRLLTLLHHIQSEPVLSQLLQHEDQVVLTSFLNFLTLQ